MYKDCEIRIYQDEYAENPREAWDNFGHIAYKHHNYKLGSEEIPDPVDWLIDKISYTDKGVQRLCKMLNCKMYSNEFKDYLESVFAKRYIAYKLYLYDHSSQSISTQSFNGRAQHAEWDSGQVGYIYCTITEAKAEGWNKKWLAGRSIRQAALDIMQGEIDVFDNYMQGNVYGFKTIDPEDDTDIDSCCGFFGDPKESGLIDEAESSIDYYLEAKAKAQKEIIESLQPVEVV